MTLECVDDIERGNGLALGVLSVGDCITDDTFEEGLEDTSGLFVDHCEVALAYCYEVDDAMRLTYWLRYA